MSTIFLSTCLRMRGLFCQRGPNLGVRARFEITSPLSPRLEGFKWPWCAYLECAIERGRYVSRVPWVQLARQYHIMATISAVSSMHDPIECQCGSESFSTEYRSFSQLQKPGHSNLDLKLGMVRPRHVKLATQIWAEGLLRGRVCPTRNPDSASKPNLKSRFAAKVCSLRQ